MTDIVRLKPLEWELLPSGQWRAKTIIGTYKIVNDGIEAPYWEFYQRGDFDSTGITDADTLDAAKAAAEAHHRAMIAPAITSPWQPMESAPKDGRLVVIDDRYGNPIVATFDESCGDGGKWIARMTDGTIYSVYPVAWMEIPPLEQPK